MFFTRASVFFTHKCNLRCPYCFEKFEGEDMTPETLIKVMDFLYKENDTGRVIAYGGEPLLRKDLIKTFLEYNIRNNIPDVQIMTNAHLIDEEFAKMLFQLRQGYGFLVVSVDDLSGGAKTLDKIIDKLEILKKYDVKYGFQITMTSAILDNLYNTVSELLKYGVLVNLRFTCEKQFESKEDVDKLEAISKKLLDDYPDKPIIFYKRTSIWGDFNKTPTNDQEYCSDYLRQGVPCISIDTNGDCYLCEHYLEDKKECVGNINDGVDFSILDVPDEFELPNSATTCVYSKQINPYLNESIARFKEYLKEKYTDFVTLDLDLDSDDYITSVIEISDALRKDKKIFNINLLVKEDAQKDLLEDFFNCLKWIERSFNVTMNLRVIDDSGILEDKNAFKGD